VAAKILGRAPYNKEKSAMASSGPEPVLRPVDDRLPRPATMLKPAVASRSCGGSGSDRHRSFRADRKLHNLRANV
jgi:hypothetical protein